MEMQRKIVAKADLVVAEEACYAGPRSAVVHNLNADIMGNGLWHGAVYCPSFQVLDRLLGVRRRKALQNKTVNGRHRARSAPRLTLHAPAL